MDLTNIIKSIPYTYKVGEKSKGLPVDLKVSLDPDFKKTLVKGFFILGGSIVLAVAINKAVKNR